MNLLNDLIGKTFTTVKTVDGYYVRDLKVKKAVLAQNAAVVIINDEWVYDIAEADKIAKLS